jgi:hypothetical protein
MIDLQNVVNFVTAKAPEFNKQAANDSTAIT